MTPLAAVGEDPLLDANRLLGTLPPDERQRLDERLEVVTFGLREVVHDQGEEVRQAIFPLDGVFSLVTPMRDGRGVEVATVGNEGFLGLPLFLQGTSTSTLRAFSQVPGRALALPASTFLEALGESPALHRALHRYTQALLGQVAQSAACNRLHPTEARASRWLLETHDRVAADTFPLTQDFLAQMLGVGRPTANLAARALQDAGLIDSMRGRITVLDRPGLEAAACECYAVIRAEYERLLETPRT